MNTMGSEDIRSLSLTDLLLRLEDNLQFIVPDEVSGAGDVFIRLSPDPDLKFAYTSEVRGIIKYQGHEINFTVSIKHRLAQSILLDPVSEFDNAQRALLEIKAVEIALKTLRSDAVHDARASVIKYQMLYDLIHLLES